jgi:hypothetical protein
VILLKLKLHKMKKQIKKLRLNKKTISNLNKVEMNKKIGGGTGWGCGHTAHCSGGCGTKNANTCPGHTTC